MNRSMKAQSKSVRDEELSSLCAEEMSYFLFLSEAYARAGQLDLAKELFTKFESLQKYPLREWEEKALAEVKKIVG